MFSLADRQGSPTAADGSATASHTHRRKLVFAPTAAPPVPATTMKRSTSSPGNLHRMARPRERNIADDFRQIGRAFGLSILAISVTVAIICNASAAQTLLLPAEWRSHAVELAEPPTKHVGSSSSLLRLGRGQRGSAATADFHNWSDAQQQQQHWDALHGTERTAASVGATQDDIFVLVGALLAVVVFLFGIRQSLVEEQAADEAADASQGKVPSASR